MQGRPYQFITKYKAQSLSVDKKEFCNENELDQYIELANYKFDLINDYPIKISLLNLDTKAT